MARVKRFDSRANDFSTRDRAFPTSIAVRLGAWTAISRRKTFVGGEGATAFTHRRDSAFFVIPAKAGIHLFDNVSHEVDPGFHRGDDKKVSRIKTQKCVNPVA
jgi:hypothetical protein